jgi:hypothetical protein
MFMQAHRRPGRGVDIGGFDLEILEFLEARSIA